MSIRENIQKTKSIISRIEETILPLQENNLWNDDEFFDDVNHFLTCETINDDGISRIVADALFRLSKSKPEVEVVKTLIEAFPMSLKCRDERKKLPIMSLSLVHGQQYILPLALEGSKHDVDGKGMGGGIRSKCFCRSILERLCGEGDERCLKTLKDLRNHNLLVKKDISSRLLYESLESPSVFEYLFEWYPEALRGTVFEFLHPFPPSATQKKKFVNFLSYAMKYYKDILFEKNNKGQTAFERAVEKYGEQETMILLREVLTKEAGYAILHEVIVHQPGYYNLFLSWFPFLYHLRDDKGRTITQVMLSSKKSFLKANPTFWINLRADQLEEKDPITSLRPFAAVAVGNDNDFNLSYQILRQHPSVMDVIFEQREKEKVKADRKRQKRQQKTITARRSADGPKKQKLMQTIL